MKKIAVISACLLGHKCRYDGKTKHSIDIEKYFNNYNIIPFCPEAPLFGTPRERISVVMVDGEKKIITDKIKEVKRNELKKVVENFIEKNKNISYILLKSKSPSCGVQTTPILNKNKEKISLGNGIAGDIFLKKFPTIKIKDETNFLG